MAAPKVAKFLALMVVGPLSVHATLSAYSFIVEDLGGDAASWQITFAALFIGWALGQLVFGVMADLLGRGVAALTALALFSVSSLLCTTVSSMDGLAIGRFGQALGVGALPLLVRVMLRDGLCMNGAAQWMSLLSSGAELLKIGAPAIGLLIVGAFSWRLLFVQQAMLGAGLAFLFAYWSRSFPYLALPQIDTTDFASRYFRGIISTQSLWGALPLSLTYAGVMVITTSSPAVLISQFNVSDGAFSLLFVVIALAAVIGMICNRYCLRTFSLRSVTLFATGVASAACGLLAISTATTGASATSFLIACMVFTLCSGFILPNTAIQVLGEDRRRLAGRAGIAGVMQYSIVAAVAFLSGVLGSSAEIIVPILVALSAASLLVQVRLLPRVIQSR